MRFSKTVIIVLALTMGSALLQGCIIPILGFGYTGYQYHEKEGVFAPGQPLGGSAPADKNNTNAKSSSSKPPPADNSVE